MLITGASSGIGRELAVRAGRAGYAVYAVGRNANALAALAAQVTEEGGMLATQVCDVSNPANAPELIGRALATFGRLDILVNNAGTAAVGPIALQTDAEMLVQFGTHVLGPLALVREALSSLRITQGHVFMLGSGVARVPIGGLGAYPPSKAALRSATSILRRELADLNIAVTYVDPGAVDTPFMKRAGMPGAPESVLVAPEEVARKILLAVETRPRVLNAAPLQTAAVALAELFPAVTDFILERNPELTGATPTRDAIATAAAQPAPTVAAVGVNEHFAENHDAGAPAVLESRTPQAAEAAPPQADDAQFIDNLPLAETRLLEHAREHNVASSEFDDALSPMLRRMERANFEPAFVRGLLVPESVIDVSEVAMRWAGMPNKHERALTNEVFFALAEAGFLTPRPDGRYLVVRAAD
jgi:hypothetical protein